MNEWNRIARRAVVSCLSIIALGIHLSTCSAQIHFANGMKIGEVTADSARIWTRLTQNPDMLQSDHEFVPIELRQINSETDPSSQLPDGVELDEMKGSVAGATGQVRLTYGTENEIDDPHRTDWEWVDSDQDFTHHFALEDLSPNSKYFLTIEGRIDESSEVSQIIEGQFRTAPLASQPEPITFCVVTCGDYVRRDNEEGGHQIYRTMLDQISPDFFVHTGDIEYYDKPNPFAVDVGLARYKWNRLFALPFQRDFHCNVASYFMKDDHDTVKNDCWEGARFGQLTWDQGLALFREQFPMGELPYRTIRWGSDLQVWMVEGRDYRSPNNMDDGPEKSIWGDEQKQWFFETVEASDATFKILISPTPVVGPDRNNKNDNHANRGFQTEGNEIREFIGRQENMFVICGDRHWQYFSIDTDHGVHEFSCGPSSNRHAGGYSENKTPVHQYLRVAGGFLSVNVSREEDVPTIVFQHNAPNGDVRNEYRRRSDESDDDE